MTDQDRKPANFKLHEEDPRMERLAAFIVVAMYCWTAFCVFIVIWAGLIWGMKFAGWV